MSSQALEAPVSATANIRAQIFEPHHFKVGDQLLHLNPEFKGKATATDEIQLTKKEFKLMEKKFVAFAEKEVGVALVTKIGSSRMITKDNASAFGYSSFQAEAIVTVFTGKGPPREKEKAGYQRMWLHDSEKSVDGLRFRWMKADFDTIVNESRVSTMLLQKRQQLPANGQDYICLHARMSFAATSVQLRDIVFDAGDAANPDRKDFNLTALNAIIAEETDTSPISTGSDAVAVQGHKAYNMLEDNIKTVKGLKFTHGTARKLWFNGWSKEELVLSEQNCFKLFFPTVSVAEILTEYLSTTKTLCDIKDSLVGVKVRISSKHGGEEKHIFKLDELPMTVSESNKHTAWIAKGKLALQYPELPCVNVGTTDRPELVPAEMCKILPMQSVGRGVPFAVSMAANQRRNGDVRAMQSSDSKVEVSKDIISSAHQKVSVEEGKERFRASFDPPPKILFVEAGTGEKFPQSWKKMCKRVVSNTMTLDEHDVTEPDSSIIDSDTLTLTYVPGTDPCKIWKQQLQKFTGKHATKNKETRKTLLVVAIMSNEGEKGMYETLKTICDTVIGKQSFFVNMNTLRGQQRESPSEGAKRAANDISRRMRIRNPSATSDKSGALSIGIHVSHFATQVSKINDDGRLEHHKEKRLLITVASREAQESRGYKTTRTLVSKAEMEIFDPSSYVKPHLDGRSSDHVILFRSGYMTQVERGSKPATIDGRSIEQKIAASIDNDLTQGFTMGTFEKVEGFELFSTTIESVQLGPAGSVLLSANAELAKLQTGLPGKQVSYILIDEADTFDITPSTEQNAAQVAAPKASGTITCSTSFIVNQPGKPDSGKHTISAQRNHSPKKGSKSISLTLLGAKLAAEPHAEGSSSSAASAVDGSDLGPFHIDEVNEDDKDDSTPKGRSTEPKQLGLETPTRASKFSSTHAPAPRTGSRSLLEQNLGVNETQQDFNALDAVPDTETSSYPAFLDPSSPQLSSNRDQRKVCPAALTTSTPSFSQTSVARPESPTSSDVSKGSTKEDSALGKISSASSFSKGDESKPAREQSPNNDGHAATAIHTTITQAELEVLADLFYDTQLEMYDTKLPIPTYLAQAAAKRTVMHLKCVREDESEAIELPEVPKEVANSLYYL